MYYLINRWSFIMEVRYMGFIRGGFGGNIDDILASLEDVEFDEQDVQDVLRMVENLNLNEEETV